MKAEHFEILVEEPSMEAFLRRSLPDVLGRYATFEVYPYNGKRELLSRLGQRLQGYAAFLPVHWRIIVLVDCDDDDCVSLKGILERSGSDAGLATRRSVGPDWRLHLGIAIEELEAWYFGDWEAVRAAYPRLSKDVPRKSAYRDCDKITGGTWEAFERELQRVGYFAGGLRKIEAARRIGTYFVAERCSSKSFAHVLGALKEALA